MGRMPFLFTSMATTFLLLCIIRLSAAQIAGCDSQGIECTSSDEAEGVCFLERLEEGIGSVSFDSNTTSDGPLTWTVTLGDGKTGGMPYTDRSFWLGTPSTLNITEVTDFGGCSIPMGILPGLLQLPDGFSDFGSYGCGTVMGDTCPQEILSRLRRELVEIVQNGTLGIYKTPCDVIKKRLTDTPLPESCEQSFQTEESTINHFVFAQTYPIFEKSPYISKKQDGCQVTTGGPDYLLNFGVNLVSTEFGEADSDAIKLHKNGTSPLFTMFYNEPWNNASTGPVSFLDMPEVHLSCLTIVPSEGQESGAMRQGPMSSGLGPLWFSFAAFLTVALLV